MNKVLVTGGAGFIGSELTRQLVERGADVTVLDNLVNGKRENIAGLLGPRCRLLASDLRDAQAVREGLRDVDHVFHLACMGVRHSIHAPHENHDVNATGSLKLLDAARSAGVGRFVYVSSSEVYGTARYAPMPEDHPTYPMTVYGASKLAGECYARAFHSTYGYPTVVIRPFNSFGPRSHHEGDSGEVIPKFMLRGLAERPLVIFGDGTQTRDFTYVEDTARGILEVGMHPAAPGGTFNLGSGSEVTINALAETVKAILGKVDIAIQHEAPRPGDVLRLCADATKARALCGFAPRVNLREGLVKLYAWIQSLEESPEQLLEHDRFRNWEV